MQKFKTILIQNGISSEMAEQMHQYAMCVTAQNATVNLTRIVSEEQMAKEHFLEAIQPVKDGFLSAGQRVLDFGTGGGFPGVPIAIYASQIEMTLLDATHKKISFVKNTCEELGISVQTIAGRGEELAHDEKYREQYDVVVVRAVADLTMLLELCSPFIRNSGLLIAYKGEHAKVEIAQAQGAAEVLHMTLCAWQSSAIPDRLGGYAVYKKLQHTDEIYPRRYAKIKAEPL